MSEPKTKVFVKIYKESHRTTYWTTIQNEHGEELTPHYFEERHKAVYTAAEYAFLLGDLDSFNELVEELKETAPIEYKMITMRTNRMLKARENKSLAPLD